ncbi:hypothetical protein D3C87_1858420 [compost metagenome]
MAGVAGNLLVGCNRIRQVARRGILRPLVLPDVERRAVIRRFANIEVGIDLAHIRLDLRKQRNIFRRPSGRFRKTANRPNLGRRNLRVLTPVIW